jgi:CDP-ribitol ribitolphosphotransferase
MTDYPQVTDLYFVSDLLVTDYSSTIVEYVLLDKPVILYAFDLEKYDRGFYRDYEDTVPGPVAHNEKEFLEILSNNTKENQKRQTFAKLQYDYIDNRSTERILSVLEL